MTRHEDLLEDYVEELADAKVAAEAWWGALRMTEAARAGNEEKALERLRRRWPDGPASHPLVLRVIRKYWLACEAINRGASGVEPPPDEPEAHEIDPGLTETGDETGAADDDDDDDDDEHGDEDEDEDEHGDEDDEHEDDDEVYPHVFIHEWLAGDHDELFEFLTSLSYWPIGIDADDDYT